MRGQPDGREGDARDLLERMVSYHIGRGGEPSTRKQKHEHQKLKDSNGLDR